MLDGAVSDDAFSCAFHNMDSAPTSRAQTSIRWVILALACIGMLGSYYSYDIPGALKKQIEDDLGLTGFQQTLLYSVYSIPNTVLPLFGGFFVDRLGTNVTLFTFCTLITLGQLLFAWGVSLNNFALMIVGRIVFGLGGESQGVAQTTLVALWFENKDLALALGINLSISRLGSVWNDNMSPYMYNSSGLSGASWFGLGVCLLSLLACIMLIILDRRTVAQLESNQAQYQMVPVETEPPVRFSDLKELSSMYWMITLSCVLVYSAVLPFNGVASSLLQDKFGNSLDTAGALLGIPFIMSAVGSPFLGGVVDRFGYRAVLLFVATVLLCGAHSLFAFTKINPILGLVLVGVGYCVYAAAIWPSVSYVVDKNKLGTAYGLITAVQNAGLALVPLLVGYIQDSTNNNWTLIELCFLCLAGLGGLVGIGLNILDAQTGRRLNRSYFKDGAAGAAGVVPTDSTASPDQQGIHVPINGNAGSESDTLLPSAV